MHMSQTLIDILVHTLYYFNLFIYIYIYIYIILKIYHPNYIIIWYDKWYFLYSRIQYYFLPLKQSSFNTLTIPAILCKIKLTMHTSRLSPIIWIISFIPTYKVLSMLAYNRFLFLIIDLPYILLQNIQSYLHFIIQLYLHSN